MRSEEEIRERWLDLANWDSHNQPRSEEMRQLISETLEWVLNDKGEK